MSRSDTSEETIGHSNSPAEQTIGKELWSESGFEWREKERERNRWTKVVRRVRRFTGSDVSDESDINDRYLHMNDRYNVPDPDSDRVLVNIGHSEDEDDVYVAKEIAKNRKHKLKAHQIGGIRFLYDNLIVSVKDFGRHSEGFGCILSHHMGLGKTVQVIAICEILLRYTTAGTVMIVLPLNVLNNWKQEFKKWLKRYKLFSVDQLSDRELNKKINRWHKSGGVLLIGYEKYLRITSKAESTLLSGSEVSSSEVTSEVGPSRPVTRAQEKTARNLLFALREPGPDLLVCDEGHRLKNDKTAISMSLKKVRTKRRVIMTGTPLQNRLLEYYHLLDFVRQKYLGPKEHFKQRFEEPIEVGLSGGASDSAKKKMEDRTLELNHLVKGFIQRRNQEVVARSVKKTEIVLLCKLKEAQIELMRQFLEGYSPLLKSNPQPPATSLVPASVQALKPRRIYYLEVFNSFSRICGHPDMFNPDVVKPKKNSKKKTEYGYSWPKPVFDRLKNESKYKELDINNSSKMELFFQILEETVKMGEKLLVFSQWVSTLDVIEKFLESRRVPNTRSKWKNGRNYCRIDGKVSAERREEMVKRFNKCRAAKLFLISTRAGGEGINLTAANRIVIFDASQNPCRDSQAACRIFREGQKRKCFIYRLISDKSFETIVYQLQNHKTDMSLAVIDQEEVKVNLTPQKIRTVIRDLSDQLPKILDNSSAESPHLEEWLSSDLLQKDDLLSKVCKKKSHLLTKEPFVFGDRIEEQNILEE